MDTVKLIRKSSFVLLFCFTSVLVLSQKPIIKIANSPYAKMHPVGIDEVTINGGFWKERQDVNRDVSLEVLWDGATNEEYGYSLQNFKIAAGLMEGRHQGTYWQDEWLYKWIETASYEYATTGDQTFLDRMDKVIPIIAQAQEEDGYIATQVTTGRFQDRWLAPSNHELYNMGHLLTAAAVNYRMTGRTDLLEIANKAAAFCLKQFQEYPDLMWEYPLNPSIIMGAVELYRTTGNKDGLELARHIVDLRGSKYEPEEVNSMWGRPEWGGKDRYLGGTDLYQNFIPLRKEREVLGHAVFFTYLYAGAADVYMETGDQTLLDALQFLWGDLTEKKMYVTGGVSPVTKGPVTRNYDGTRRHVNRWDPIHEGITTPFDLPNAHTYNETCGMVGNMMWNWRMLQITGDPRYAEIMELSWYNSILTGVQLDGSKWSYTNPLRWHGEEHELWSHDYHERHVPGIRHICCPTNLTRNISAYHGYLYSVSENTFWVHHFAEAQAKITDLGLSVNSETNYPWDGNIKFTIEDVQHDNPIAFKLRIPSWTSNTKISVNGEVVEESAASGTYATIERTWKKGDVLIMDINMDILLLGGNPLSEQIRNQIAIKRGPVVYCLESNDVKGEVDFESITIDLNNEIVPVYVPDLLGGVTVLQTTAKSFPVPKDGNIIGQYVNIGNQDPKPIDIQLIPYFSWNNRKEPKMTVWLPFTR